MSEGTFTYRTAANLDIIAIGLEQMNLFVQLASRAEELTEKQQSILLADLQGRIEEMEQACFEIKKEVEA